MILKNGNKNHKTKQNKKMADKNVTMFSGILWQKEIFSLQYVPNLSCKTFTRILCMSLRKIMAEVKDVSRKNGIQRMIFLKKISTNERRIKTGNKKGDYSKSVPRS